MTSSANRSQERDVLHGHIERDKVARETQAAAQKNFDRAKDQLEQAQARAQAAQSDLQKLDAEESRLIAESWPPRDLTEDEKKKRRDAEESLAAAVRILKTVEENVRVAQAAYEDETAKVQPIGKDVDDSIARVLVEEGQLALKHLVETRKLAVEAEAAARSIAAALVARGRFAEAEKINTALHGSPRPEGTVNAGPYLDLMARLRGNADAETAEPVEAAPVPAVEPAAVPVAPEPAPPAVPAVVEPTGAAS
jgi:hypothetical protein